jgi:putative membrane protein
MARETEEKAVAAPDQTQLAVERTLLAHERTLMAWTRTATGLIGFGFGLYKFFYFMHEKEPEKYNEQVLSARTFGLVMIGIGVLALAVAVWQHHGRIKRLQAQYPDASFSLSLIMAALIAALGILGFIIALFRL